MSLIYRLFLNNEKCANLKQIREYATIYTKTLNLPTTKFPAYVKKTKRPEHDKKIREVKNGFYFGNISSVKSWFSFFIYRNY